MYKQVCSKTYMVWVAMRARCNNKRHKDYMRYGGRGIIVCERWSSFPNFLTDMGEKPEGLTLERKDNDGPYAPWNCKWATRKEQVRNSSRLRFLTHHGQTLCIADWASTLGIPAANISARLYRGVSVERALTKGRLYKRKIHNEPTSR